MNKLHYNIKLNVKTLKVLFKHFDMNENNTIIELNTKSKSVRKNIEEYKEKIVLINDESIYLKKFTFGKLYYFLSKNFISHVIFYKSKSIKSLSNSEVKVEISNAKIYKVYFNDKYDINKTKELLKKYRSIDIEYIILFLLLIGGIIIYFLRK